MDNVSAGAGSSVAWEHYEDCRLCPRDCGVNRLAGVCGWCGETSVCRLASATPHFGEEPSFSGRHGSGTMFFGGCSCGCFFCQNYQISQDHFGDPVGPDELLQRALELVRRGVHNLNLVTPDHFWPHVEWLCGVLRQRGIDIPVAYNCSGYAKTAVIEQVAQAVDIFMPDMKFADPALADLCIGDSRYPDLALQAIEVMVARKGMLRPWDDSGRVTARKGVLVRHLVLPGHTANSIAVLDALHRQFGPALPLSVMSQYRPTPTCLARHELDRMVSDEEYGKVVRHVEDLGFEHVYIQPAHGDEEFMPDFGDHDEPFAGNRRERPRL